MTRLQATPESSNGARDFHLVLAAGFLPVLSLPVVWWLMVRRYVNRPTAFSKRSDEILYGRWSTRALLVVLVDTMLAVAMVAALMMGPKIAADEEGAPHVGHGAVHIESGKVQSGERLGRTSKRERAFRKSSTSLRAPMCREAWSGLSRSALFPVFLGIGAILALWLRGRRRGDGTRHRWIWVIVPLTLAPLIGAASAFGACEWWGSWSVSVAMVGLMMQSLALFIIGAIMLRLLQSELTLVMGSRLSTARACGHSLFFMSAFFTRFFCGVLALSLLVPDMSSRLQNAGVRAVLAGDGEVLGRLLVLLTVVTLVPLGEEMIFRGILLPGLARRMSADSALVVSALLFALFHVPSHGLAAVGPGVLALIFGWARLRTGGLRAPVILHAGNNLLVILIAWVV